MHVVCNRVPNGRSRSSKVADLGTNRKRVCDFLLLVNVVTLLQTSFVSHIMQVFRWKQNPPLIDPIFLGVSLWLHRRHWSPQERRSLFSNDLLQQYRTMHIVHERQNPTTSQIQSDHKLTSSVDFVVLNGFHHTSRSRFRGCNVSVSLSSRTKYPTSQSRLGSDVTTAWHRFTGRGFFKTHTHSLHSSYSVITTLLNNRL